MKNIKFDSSDGINITEVHYEIEPDDKRAYGEFKTPKLALNYIRKYKNSCGWKNVKIIRVTKIIKTKNEVIKIIV